jgi:hypothetical protein
VSGAFDAFLGACVADCVEAAEPDLAPLLSASLELVAAIERVTVLEGDRCSENALCSCGARLMDCAEVFVSDGSVRTCSRECLALELLWRWHPQQDQSEPTVRATVALIASSFARARAARRCSRQIRQPRDRRQARNDHRT